MISPIVMLKMVLTRSDALGVVVGKFGDWLRYRFRCLTQARFDNHAYNLDTKGMVS